MAGLNWWDYEIEVIVEYTPPSSNLTQEICVDGVFSTIQGAGAQFRAVQAASASYQTVHAPAGAFTLGVPTNAQFQTVHPVTGTIPECDD